MAGVRPSHVEAIWHPITGHSYALCGGPRGDPTLNLNDMGKKTKKLSFWMRRKSHIPVLVIGTLVVILLSLNEETSVKLNMEYQNRINELRQEIKLNEDSAAYYRARREAIEHGTVDLEHVAREQFHMQKPSEDVFLIKE